MDNYFKMAGISNSDLRKCRRIASGESLDSVLENVHTDAMRMGTLLDALLTDPKKLSPQELQCEGIQYTQQEWDEAIDDSIRVLSHNVCGPIVKSFDSQVIKTTELEVNGRIVLGRCKFDWLGPGLGIDLKYSKCKNHEQFLKHLDYLDYDQQAAWYMDLAKVNEFIFLIVPRGGHPIFMFSINRGDRNYLSGLEKYTFGEKEHFKLTNATR